MNEHNDIPLGQDFALELEQFHSETRARPEELQAIRRKLRAAQTQQHRPPLRLLSIGLLGAATAAAAGLAVTAWQPQAPQAPQQIALSAAAWSEVSAGEHVLLGFAGQGDLTTAGTAHDIDWRSGELKVSVTPQQGIDLVVSTPEASVSVVGTIFSVSRDLLGTTISVEHGTVEVACTGAEPLQLTDGQLHTCLPTTPMGLLNRAQELKSTDTAAALIAIDLGLAMVTPDSTDFDDLHYRAAEIHREAGRHAHALAAATAALSGGDATYTPEAHHIAAEQALILGDRDTAARHLTWLAENGSAEPEELAILGDHLAASDPETALKWLHAAEEATTDPGLQEKIRGRILRLTP